MPREKSFTKMIPKIYKCNAENLGLFFFIKAQLQTFPTLSVEGAMSNFRRFTGITIDDWDDESMRATYNRLQREYYKELKCEHTKEDKRTTGA
jgi:hypothetical protein